VQEILEKFEFFPIKCRIQRAAALFQMNEEIRLRNRHMFKSKVPPQESESVAAVTFCRRMRTPTTVLLREPLSALQRVSTLQPSTLHLSEMHSSAHPA
jgi:hypothetical protein